HNIGRLSARKHVYFVPFGQDDPVQKRNSLTADFSLLPATLEAALTGRQLQPLLTPPPKSG
ncbi:MAG: dipicolinate synthase subunit B, partial [Oscillospiraceae bacterium]|nr:dipicolinate synthase subunit B [Oscillospiraceae bacterium]